MSSISTFEPKFPLVFNQTKLMEVLERYRNHCTSSADPKKRESRSTTGSAATVLPIMRCVSQQRGSELYSHAGINASAAFPSYWVIRSRSSTSLGMSMQSACALAATPCNGSTRMSRTSSSASTDNLNSGRHCFDVRTQSNDRGE